MRVCVRSRLLKWDCSCICVCVRVWKRWLLLHNSFPYCRLFPVQLNWALCQLILIAGVSRKTLFCHMLCSKWSVFLFYNLVSQNCLKIVQKTVLISPSLCTFCANYTKKNFFLKIYNNSTGHNKKHFSL